MVAMIRRTEILNGLKYRQYWIFEHILIYISGILSTDYAMVVGSQVTKGWNRVNKPFQSLVKHFTWFVSLNWPVSSPAANKIVEEIEENE